MASTTFLRFSKHSQRILLQTTKRTSIHSPGFARTIIPLGQNHNFSTSSFFQTNNTKEHDRNQLLDENNSANTLNNSTEDKKQLFNPNDRSKWFTGHPIARYALMGTGAAFGLYLSFKIIKASLYVVGLAAIGGSSYYVYRRVQGTHRPLDKFIAQNAKELTQQGGSLTKNGISRATATAGTWVSRFVGSKSWLENAVEQKPIFEDVVRSMSTQQSTDEKDSTQDVPPTKFDKDDSKSSEPESPTKKKQKEFQNKDTQAGGREFGQDSMRPSRDTSYSKGGDGRVWEQAKQEARDSYKDWKRSEKKSDHKPTTESKRDFTTSTSDYIKDKAQQTEKKAQQAWEGAKDKAHEWMGPKENVPGESSLNETRSAAEGVKQSVKEKAQQAWETAKDTASTGKEKLDEARGPTIDAVKDKAEKVKEKVQNAWEGVKETVKETIGQTHHNEQNKEQAKQEAIGRDQQKK